MLLCSLVLCVLLSLNLSKAEGIPSDARTAAKKFQNALSQQNMQTVLSSIEERLRNLDSIYSMQYSPSVEGKLEMYGRKLESVEAKISRLEAVMSNELDKISENISSRNFKDDLSRDHLLRKIDSLYDRVNHRLIFAESKMELIERKIENKLDAVLLRIEKMDDSLDIKDADMHGEIADVLSCIEEIKTRTDSIENKIINVSKVFNEDVRGKNIQSDETIFSTTYENITASVRKDMKEHFEVLSNKIVDFHESSWQTYDRLERTLKSMSLVSNLTRYEIQNGLRSLTVEVGRLGGGEGLVSDSSKEKSKLHEIDKKIDSNFESLMLAQNLFMENCYRLQKDEPQLETKISEVLDQMINTFNAKTAVEPKDIKKLEQIIKNHDQGVRNGFKNLGSILSDSRLTNKRIEDGFSSLDSIKTDLAKLSSSVCYGEANATYRKIEEAVFLVENLQNTTIDLHQSVQKAIEDGITISHLQQAVEKLGNYIDNGTQEILRDSTHDYINSIKKSVENIETNMNKTDVIFNDDYSHYFRLFLDEYSKNYIKKINEIFGINVTDDTASTTTGDVNIVKEIDTELIGIIKSNCFRQIDYGSLGETPIFSCLKGILSEDVIVMIQNYCSMSVGLPEEACLRKIVGFTDSGNELESISDAVKETIKTNCFHTNYVANSTNFECLKDVLDEDDVQKIKSYCQSYPTLSDVECLRNITGPQSTETITEKLGVQTIEMIKSNCFPSIDVRRSFENNISNLECLKGFLNDSTIEMIRNYCLLNSESSEGVCLMSIIGLKPEINIAEELGVEVIEMIKSNCFPDIDVRSSETYADFQCLAFLNDSIVSRIQNYCSIVLPSSPEDCLRNITGFNNGINIIEELGAETIEMIKSKCFANIDQSSPENYADFECLKTFVNDSIIGKIQNYCSLVLPSSHEACLRNITGLKDGMNIIEELGAKTIEIIKSNCFPDIDIRESRTYLNFECLQGVLNETVIQRITSYCSSNLAFSEEACLKNITGSKSSVDILEEITSDMLEAIRSNCFPAFDIRKSENLSDFECLNGILNIDVVDKIKNYCIAISASSAEVCLRNITTLKITDTINIKTISIETIEIIRSNCLPQIDSRISENSTKLECLKGLLSDDLIRNIKDYCSLNMAYSEEACLKTLLNDFRNVTITGKNGNRNSTLKLLLDDPNEDVQNEFGVQETFATANSTSDAETTAEFDYYQNSEVESSEYEDYSSDNDDVL